MASVQPRSLCSAACGQASSRRAAVPAFSVRCARPQGQALAPSAALLHESTSPKRPILVTRAAAVEDAPAAAPLPPGSNMADVELLPICDTQGYILSDPSWNSPAYIFCVYDEKAKAQYVGFSKDLKNSLRTVFTRRPEKAYFFKAFPFASVDQDAMVAVRDAWFVEMGGMPPGNKLALERKQWQEPVDGGAISQRGKQGAAEDKARQILEVLKQRGCKEVFEANPTLLADGLVDFLPAKSLSSEQLEESQRAKEQAAKAMRSANVVIDGHERKYQIAYDMKFPTNGGHMFDVRVMLDGRETKHRIIVGKEYYEPAGATPEEVVEAAMSLLLSFKVCRQTDGLLLSSQYPVNYFSITQLEQWFRDDFRAELAKVIGSKAYDTERNENFWRFNKIHDYGPMNLETAEELDIALTNGFRVTYDDDE